MGGPPSRARRAGLADRLERRRRPSLAQMDAAERELEQQRTPAPADTRPEIALPEEEGHPHGILVMAFNPATQDAWGFNFVVHPWRGDETIRAMADDLDAFLKDRRRKHLEFTSPHDGRIHCLTREGARRVIAVDHARTRGPVAPHSEVARLVRITPGMLRPD